MPALAHVLGRIGAEQAVAFEQARQSSADEGLKGRGVRLAERHLVHALPMTSLGFQFPVVLA